MTDAAPAVTTAPDSLSPANYAASHDVIRVSSKRLALSPWSHHYVDDRTVFGTYGGRLYPLSLGADPADDYWHLRNVAGLFDVPERPIEISGPEAEPFLNHLLTRDMSTVPSGRARYALACDADGRILMDGVLIRWASDRFWYVLADGDFLGWMRAQASGYDVRITDPGSWVLQVQGPRALEILAELCDSPLPDPFPYFAAETLSIAGQDLLVTRTGWTGELGFEIYTMPDTDCDALWDVVNTKGSPLGLRNLSLECMGIRRIEAGILDNGTDMDPTMTPYEVGLGRYVDDTKQDFVGKAALSDSPRSMRLTGITGSRAPKPGEALMIDGRVAGHVRAGAWSPSLACGIGYAFLDGPVSDTSDPAGAHTLTASDGTWFSPAALPFLDPDKRLARGLPLD